MEIKINREIRDYSESMFFGLSMRQLFFALIAIVVAVGVYFLLEPLVGTETVSWMCILSAAPFAALGFVKYHGMSAEKFLWVWLRSEMLEPKQLKALPTTAGSGHRNCPLHRPEAYVSACISEIPADGRSEHGSAHRCPQN